MAPYARKLCRSEDPLVPEYGRVRSGYRRCRGTRATWPIATDFKPGRRVLSLSCEDSGADDAAFVRDGRMVVRLAGVENELVSRRTEDAGHHNVINALAAAAAALACGASAASVRGGL